MKEIKDFYHKDREYEYDEYFERGHNSYYTEINPLYEKKYLDYDIFGNRGFSYGYKSLSARRRR